MSNQAEDKKQSGFTIVELLIATSVLSILLIMVTVVMIGIGNLYYKGINQARVQTATRSITDEVSQHLQLSNGSSALVGKSKPIDGTTYTIKTYCMGDTRYSYVVGLQLGSNSVTDPTNPQIPHVLWRDSVAAGSCGSLDPADLTNANLSDGAELIPPNSRLTVFNIIGAASPYNVNVGVAYGDLDLLTAADGDGVRCRGTIGDQFCATARLDTTVAQRL